MNKDGQQLTKLAYLDPEIVSGYLEEHGKKPKLFNEVENFAKSLKGKKIIDVGCGTGHDAHHFAELGYEVTAVDYSPEMINVAKDLKDTKNPPTFEVVDMRELETKFEDNSFDGAWVSASLLHIPEADVPKVLSGLKKIIVSGGKIYIGLKEGKQGAQIVSEDKYGKPMEREFIFWEEDNFKKVAEENGLKVIKVEGGEGGKTGNQKTSWLNFTLEVNK